MSSSALGRRLFCRAQLILLICALSLGAHAQKVKVEYNKAIDFTKYKTFAWAPLGTVARPMLAAAIQGAVEDELTKRGLSKQDNNPDLVLEMYGGVDTDMRVTANNPLYSGMGGVPDFGTGFVMWGYTPGGSTMITVHKGQLVLDVIDFAQRKLVWRGVATGNLSSSPNKLVDQVNDTMKKMFKEYPSGK